MSASPMHYPEPSGKYRRCGPDIIDSRRRLFIHGGHVGPDDVFDINKIAGLVAVAEYGNLPAFCNSVGKDIDDAAFAVAALAFAVDVGVAQNCIGKAEHVMVHLNILFSRHLRQTIKGCWLKGRVFCQRHLHIVPIYGSRRRKEKF